MTAVDVDVLREVLALLRVQALSSERARQQLAVLLIRYGSLVARGAA